MLSLGVGLAIPAAARAQQIPTLPQTEASDESRAVKVDGTNEGIAAPRVLSTVEPTYPSTVPVSYGPVNVDLFLTIAADGTLNHAEPIESGHPDFDTAALEAVHKWHFEAAQLNGAAVPSRIRVRLTVAPPMPLGAPAIEPSPAAPEHRGAPRRVPKEEDAAEVLVHGKRSLRAESRSTSDFTLDRDVLTSAPRQEGADVLRTAPGLYLGRGEGAAVAHNYMLRGFDASHGQDIEFRVGGIPINLPSHIHGQGYANLGFLIGDVVQELRVSEGVHDPRQGDFAVAGSIHIDLGVAKHERGVRARSSYGSFNTFRQLALWAPRATGEETFGAVQYQKSRGFGENRAAEGGSGIVQHRFGKGEVTYRALGIVDVQRSSLAGVVRTDDVAAGTICFACAYPYPTARAQSATAQRFMAGLFADYARKAGDNGQLGLWFGHDNFRLQENFTGFLQQSRTLERVAGRGDLIEQQNRTWSLGLTGRYRTALYRPARGVHGTIELGTDSRLDVIEQTQRLLDASVRNQTWDTRVDAGVRAVDLGVWGDLDWCFTQYVRARIGMRADVLSYDIEDRLGNFAPIVRPQDTFIPGYRRSALGTAWGPRASMEVRPIHWLTLQAAYGTGYRSPQARLLDDGEPAPFSAVRSADAGVRFEPNERLRLTIGGYYTHLSDDVAFEAEEGRLERIGATRRWGAVAHVLARPLSWLTASGSFTFVDATLLEPPPASAEEPQPPFAEGQNLPFVPPIVVRADVGARHTFVQRLAGHPFWGRAGIGLSYLSARPLPYGDQADPFALLDASAGLGWGPVELGLEVFNLLDTRYAAVEYSFASDWDPNDGVRPRTPARHTSAGAPFSWMVSLGVTL